MIKILLVEDNEMNRDMLSRRLERRGYKVVCALDGQQAVALAKSEAPGLRRALFSSRCLRPHSRRGEGALKSLGFSLSGSFRELCT